MVLTAQLPQNFEQAQQGIPFLMQDFEEIFHLNNLTQGLFRVLLIFLSTIILVGYRAPIFFGLAAFVILVNIGVLLFFLQVEREVGSLGASHN